MADIEQKYHEGAVAIPEFAAFVADHPTGFCEQKLITCGYYLTSTPEGLYGYCGSTGNNRGELGSQGDQAIRDMEGIGGPVGYIGPLGHEPSGWTKDTFALKVKYPSFPDAQMTAFNQDLLKKLVNQLDISPPGGRVTKEKYQPLALQRNTQSVKQTTTFGLYKRPLFDEFAAVLRKMNPKMDDLEIAYYRGADEDDFNSDFTETRIFDTEEGCIEKSQTIEYKSVDLDTWTVTLEIHYVDLIKPANMPILRDIHQIVEACSN
jgi:hypothetical protein